MRNGTTMLRGFGEVEAAAEATVNQPKNQGLKMGIAVGAIGFIGLGMLYGMSRASGSGASRYRWGGL